MARLQFLLTAYTAADPFTAISVTVIASNGPASAIVPCEPITMQEIEEKKAMLAQSLWNHETLASICADKLGVPVTARVT